MSAGAVGVDRRRPGSQLAAAANSQGEKYEKANSDSIGEPLRDSRASSKSTGTKSSFFPESVTLPSTECRAPAENELCIVTHAVDTIGSACVSCVKPACTAKPHAAANGAGSPPSFAPIL